MVQVYALLTRSLSDPTQQKRVVLNILCQIRFLEHDYSRTVTVLGISNSWQRENYHFRNEINPRHGNAVTDVLYWQTFLCVFRKKSINREILSAL